MAGKIGIVADNYKLPKFRELLNEKGLVYTEEPFSKDKNCTVIKVLGAEQTVVHAICLTVEAHYKQAN